MNATALLLATLYNHLTTLRGALEGAGWTVDAYDDAREALERLRGEPLQAVFCDEYLRGASPAGLLAWSRRLAPELPFYLFAMNVEGAHISGPHEPDAVLQFPPEPGNLPTAGEHERPFETSAAAVPLRGDLSLLPLTSLLDMLGIARQSALVAIEGDAGGFVAVEAGTLRHVECGSHRGVRALAELLHLERGSFRVEAYRAPKRRTLNVPAATALTEAAKLIDELERDRALIDGARRACPSATGIAAGYPLSGVPRVGVGEAQRTFDAGCRLLDANRGAVAKLSHVCVEGEPGALAAVVYGDGNVIAAMAPTGQSLRLLAGLSQVVRGRAAD